MAKGKSKKKQVVDELEGKVLVAKPGKEEEFIKQFNEMIRIAQGSLGWRGHAEMYLELGVLGAMGIKLKSRKKENKLKELESLLKQVFLQNLYEVSEWVTKEQAESRAKYNKVLYEQKAD
jgi:hypothetical protein